MYYHWSKNDVVVKENYIGLLSALNYIVVFFIGDKSNNINYKKCCNKSLKQINLYQQQMDLFSHQIPIKI